MSRRTGVTSKAEMGKDPHTHKVVGRTQFLAGCWSAGLFPGKLMARRMVVGHLELSHEVVSFMKVTG